MADSLTITTTVEVTWDRISDLFVGAFEGGSNYWYTIVNHNKSETPECRFLAMLPTYEKGYVDIIDKEGDENTLYRVDREVAEKGLKIMAEKYPHHFRNFIDEQDDAITADVFLQCCVFEELIYG